MHRRGEPTQEQLPVSEPRRGASRVAPTPPAAADRVSRLQEPRHHPARAPHGRLRKSPARPATRSRSTNTRIPRDDPRSSQKRGYLEDKSRTLPCARIQKPLRPAATRVRRVPWRDSAIRRVPWRDWESASLGVSWCWTGCLLLKSSCPGFCDSGPGPSRGMRHPRAQGRGSRRPQTRRRRSRRSYADERDVARRLAQQCSLQPHSFAPLKNSLLRMRLSLPRFITSLALSCASNMPGRGREVQAEWPRTLAADRAELESLVYEGALVLNMHR